MYKWKTKQKEKSSFQKSTIFLGVTIGIGKSRVYKYVVEYKATLEFGDRKIEDAEELRYTEVGYVSVPYITGGNNKTAMLA